MHFFLLSYLLTVNEKMKSSSVLMFGSVASENQASASLFLLCISAFKDSHLGGNKWPVASCSCTTAKAVRYRSINQRRLNVYSELIQNLNWLNKPHTGIHFLKACSASLHPSHFVHQRSHEDFFFIVTRHQQQHSKVSKTENRIHSTINMDRQLQAQHSGSKERSF